MWEQVSARTAVAWRVCHPRVCFMSLFLIRGKSVILLRDATFENEQRKT